VRPGVSDTAAPHLIRAPRLEDAASRSLARWLWTRGWRTSIEPYPGYGAPGWIRVLARTVLRPPRSGGLPERRRRQRGWRSLVTAQVTGVVVEVRLGSRVHRVTSDRGGYIDAVVPADLAPGWHDVELAVSTARVTAPVLVVDPEARSGIVSDIDDTVMVTSAPRPLLAAWNTFVRSENARRPVPGMADLYQRLLRADPRTPVLYLSTEAWNAAPALGRFLRRHGYPAGPLLLTDWGPTRTGWFRDGVDHKRAALRRLTREFPQVRWLLVGDDGQWDPEIYAELAAEQPDRVRALAIRQVADAGPAAARGPAAGGVRRAADAGVPVVAERDGTRLARGLKDAGLDLT
jgi:phosphatidate phosphatase APP1